VAAGPFSAGSVVSNEPTEPRSVLGMKHVVLMIIGTVIVSGIFLVPSIVLRAVDNSSPMALLAWVAGGSCLCWERSLMAS
jgi:hypothetical protein